MEIQLPQKMTTVLAVLSQHEVRSLLMGGQACVVYGASEFSRDIDIAIYAEPANFDRLRGALADLGATVVAVPPFTPDILARGHSVHFRCAAADDVRLDIMSVMRNVPAFDVCWSRRSIMPVKGVGAVDVLGLEDLLTAKKTRRDKDWPVVRKLVDVHYRDFGDEPTASRVEFWLRELRTPAALVDIARRAPDAAAEMAAEREVVARAIELADGRGSLGAVRLALRAEEDREREADEIYWAPLLKELEAMRHERRRSQEQDPRARE